VDRRGKPLSDPLSTQRVVLGRIVGAFGIGGWLKVHSFTDPPANILRYSTWHVQLRGETKAVKPLQGRMTAKGVQVRFDEVSDRTIAEQWTGAEIVVDRSDLPPPPPGQYYWTDLVGLKALALDGQELGTIVEIRELPAHPLLVIRPRQISEHSDGQTSQPSASKAAGNRDDFLVPLVPQRLKAVDLQSGVATVDWSLDWLE
jgi:16S rRNA processing protein RimM